MSPTRSISFLWEKPAISRWERIFQSLAHGKSVHTSLQVAQTLEEKHKVSAEVVDIPIRALDTETILPLSAKQTECCWSKKTNRFAAWMLKLLFLFKIRLSITLTLQSRGFPPSTLRKLTARHSENVQIPNHDRVLGKAMELI